MTLSWSARRQLLYYAVGILFSTVLLSVLWQAFLTQTPTCFDGAQNGTESGVDCGGSCARLCSEEAVMPSILWARSLESAPQTYTGVAYIQNRTEGAGAKQVPYSFQLFDDKNDLVVEREGVADIPPIMTVPVILPNINVGSRTVARTLFKFTATPIWERVRADALPQVRITQQSLSADGTRLSALIINDGFEDIENLAVAGVVFDAAGIARAASITVLEHIPAKGSEPTVFTWGRAVADVARAEITVLPSF